MARKAQTQPEAAASETAEAPAPEAQPEAAETQGQAATPEPEEPAAVPSEDAPTSEAPSAGEMTGPAARERIRAALAELLAARGCDDPEGLALLTLRHVADFARHTGALPEVAVQTLMSLDD